MSKKLLLIIIIVAVALVLVSIPLITVMSMHNSVYDCSFEYVTTDDLIGDIAKKHTYYNASDKTVEVELNQDLINSLIKDNFESLEIALPKNFSINEIMFNTKDQRVYINAKYGFLNVPISIKLNININDDGIELVGSDIMLGKKKAPGIVKNQIPADSLKFAVKYEDLGVPQVYTVKEIKFGTGITNLVIQLDSQKIVDMAMGYRSDLMEEIDKVKDSQSGIIGTFIDKFLETDTLSEPKVKGYVEQLLNNEELVNSAIQFAFADNLTKYSDSLAEAQQKVADWATPLQVLKYYGTIDETVETIVGDEKLRELLAWFLPEDTIDEYVATIYEYVGLYQYYMTALEDTKYSLAKAAANADISSLQEYIKTAQEYAVQAEDTRKLLIEQISLVDTDKVIALVDYLEQDQSTGGEFIKSIDTDNYAEAKPYIYGLGETKVNTLQYLNDFDTKEIDKYSKTVSEWEKFVVDLLNLLKKENIEGAADLLMKKDFSKMF